MNHRVELLLRMIRVTELWEWCYTVALIALTLCAVFYTDLHLPRFVVGLLIVPVIVMFVGLFFIIDNIRARAH